jgi:hypothetical protein
VIVALLAITDSRFQDELIASAQKSGKLRQSYRLPIWARTNTPERLRKFGPFPEYPFGNDWTREEEKLSGALSRMKEAGLVERARVLLRGFGVSPQRFAEELRRLNLLDCHGIKARVMQRVVLGALIKAELL